MSRPRARGRGNNVRSIDVTDDQNNLSDNEEGVDAINSTDNPTGAEYAWALGGQYRDHVVQNLLHLGSNLGVYKTVPVPGKDGVFEKLFYRGLNAPDEVDGIRMLLIDQDSPQTRDLMIYCDTMKLVPKYLVPLFVQAVDEKPFAVTLIRLFLLLTKPLSKEVTDAINGIFKKRKSSKETAAEQRIRTEKELAIKKNAYQQLNAQLMFKEAIVNHDVFVVLLKLLEDPISKPSPVRTPEDKFYIESVLTLINNLLRISSGRFSPQEDVRKSRVIHNKLVLILEGAFLDTILLMCHGVMEKDNNPWRAILVDIVHYILSQREAKDLYRSFTDQIVPSTLSRPNQNQAMARNNASASSSVSSSNPSIPSTQAQRRQPASKDLLLDQVISDRNMRHAAVRLNPNRSSRFAGQFVVDRAMGSTSNSAPASNPGFAVVGSNFTTAAANNSGKSGIDRNGTGASSGSSGPSTYLPQSRAMIVTEPLAKDFERPNAPRRNKKRSAPFIVDDVPKSNLALLGGKEQLEDDARATKVVASFLNEFLAQGAFSELVFSIKEGWRRGVDDVDGLATDEEMRYYMMMTTCLRFFRMQLDPEMKKRDLATHGNKDAQSRNASGAQGDNSDDGVDGWRPDLKPVMQCFDRMSFIRPVDFINRLYKVEKRPDKVMYLMELYTELVCYLRIMAESRDEAHNDISLGALYKIFYIRQEREDPLPFLVREWRSGIYSRRHLNSLITMAYEIMKTLDAARARFKEEARSEGLNDDGEIAKDGADKDGKPRKKRAKRPNGVADADRITYLVAALKFDPDEYLKRSLATQQAIKMYTSLLELYPTNHVAVNHYLTTFIQRLYLFKFEDDYCDISKRGSEAGISLCYLFFNARSLIAFDALLQDPGAERNNHLEKLVRLVKQIVVLFGTLASKNRMLFVEALFYPHHQTLLHQLDTVYDAKSYGSGGLKSAHEKGYYGDSDGGRSSSEESDFGEEFDEADVDITGTVKRKPKDRKNNKSRSSKEGKNKRSWSSAEDKILKQKYDLYAGTYSVFDMIANDDEFRALGGNRSKTAIEKRVRQLNLHLSRDVDSGSDVDDAKSKGKSADAAVSGSDEDEISFGSSSSSDESADEDSTTGDGGASENGDEKRRTEKRRDKPKTPASQEQMKTNVDATRSSADPSGFSKVSKKSRYDLSNFAVGSSPTADMSRSAVQNTESDSEEELDLIDDVEGPPAVSANSSLPSVDVSASSPPPRFSQNKSRKTSPETSPGNQRGRSKVDGSDLSWLDDGAANSDDEKWSGMRSYKPRTSSGTTSAAPMASTSHVAAPTGKLQKKRRVASDDEENDDDGLWNN